MSKQDRRIARGRDADEKVARIIAGAVAEIRSRRVGEQPLDNEASDMVESSYGRNAGRTPHQEESCE